MNRNQINQVARMLTEDPDIFNESLPGAGEGDIPDAIKNRTAQRDPLASYNIPDNMTSSDIDQLKMAVKQGPDAVKAFMNTWWEAEGDKNFKKRMESLPKGDGMQPTPRPELTQEEEYASVAFVSALLRADEMKRRAANPNWRKEGRAAADRDRGPRRVD